MTLPLVLRAGGLLAVAAIGLGVLIGLLSTPGAGDADAGGRIVALGMLLLLLTPLASLTAAVLDFARGGERRYVLIGIGALSLLAASLAGGLLIGLRSGG